MGATQHTLVPAGFLHHGLQVWCPTVSPFRGTHNFCNCCVHAPSPPSPHLPHCPDPGAGTKPLTASNLFREGPRPWPPNMQLRTVFLSSKPLDDCRESCPYHKALPPAPHFELKQIPPLPIPSMLPCLQGASLPGWPGWPPLLLDHAFVLVVVVPTAVASLGCWQPSGADGK